MKKVFLILSIVLFSFALFSVSLFFIKTPNDNNSDNKSQVETINFSNKSYVAFGDSITFGSDYFRGYEQMDNPYPSLILETLGLKSSINKGISGATLAQHSSRANIATTIQSFDEEYDIISVLGGVNDYDNNLPLGTFGDTTNETIYGSLDLIAKTLTEKFKTSFIFFMTPYKCYWHNIHWSTNNEQGYNLEDVANAIKEVANKYSIPVLDLFKLGQFELEMYNSNSDGLHPSQEFIISYTAPQIAQFIKDNYKQK